MATDPPATRGFRLPGEFEPQRAVWLAWPHDPLTWVAGVEAAEDAYISLLDALSPSERVEVLVRDGSMQARVVDRFDEEGLEGIGLHVVDYADSWLRDTGPMVLVRDQDGARLAVDWRFDAWGGKYEGLLRDDALAARVAKLQGLPAYRTEMVLEGGAIDSNGQGTLLTTEQCLLHPNRGEDRTRSSVEHRLAEILGARNVVWLGEGITGDDTDGHVDDVARFVAEDTVVCCVAEESHPDHEVLAENRERLDQARDQDGEPFQVLELPMPEPVHWEGEPVPASYANFLIANNVVVVPTFEDPADEKALSVLDEAFPERRVRGVDARDLVVGFGTVHCLTLHEPAPGTRG